MSTENQTNSSKMHPEGEHTTTGVPAFLAKLWTLVDDASTDEFIAWDASGRSFHVFDQASFAKMVLPLFFKHSNIASFVRQLNMYGFRKVVNLDSGSLKHEKDDMEFAHPYFIKDREDLLENIKRKTAHAGGHGDVKVKTEGLHEVLSDVKTIKTDQEFLTSKLDNLKKENEALWREVASMRQKHSHQQKVVNRLIQFLVTLVGNRQSRNLGKRKIPLMLNDASQIKAAKASKFSRQLSCEGNEYQIDTPESALQLSHDGSLSSSSNSLKICDITEVPSPTQVGATATVTTSYPEASATATSPNPEASVTNSNPGASTGFEFQIPQASQFSSPSTNSLRHSASTDSLGSQKLPPELLQLVDTPASTDSNDIIGVPDQKLLNQTAELQNMIDNVNAETSNEQTLSQQAGTSNITGNGQQLLPSVHPKSIIKRELSREDLSQLVDSTQDNIESLRDLLSGGQYNIDSSALLGLFNHGPEPGLSSDGLMQFEDTLPTLLPEQPSSSGQEVMQYIPSNIDLNSLLDIDGVIPNDLPPDEEGADLNTPLSVDFYNPTEDTTLPTDVLD